MGYKQPMFGLSLGHLVLLLVIVLIFRARKLPEIGRGMRDFVETFKRGWRGEELAKSKKHQKVEGPIEPDAVLPAQKKNGEQ